MAGSTSSWHKFMMHWNNMGMLRRILMVPLFLTLPSVAALSTQCATQTEAPVILPARHPLPSFYGDSGDESFSLLSWNILLPNSKDNWWCHKQYSSGVDMSKRTWEHRHLLIKERLLHSDADIVCIQEADGDTFDEDFAFMMEAGYDHVLHRKFRFRCATFFKGDEFMLENVAHKDRTLVTSLRSKRASKSTEGSASDRILHIVNCHLSGGAAPERRLRQVHDAVDQIRKFNNAKEQELTQQRKRNRPSPKIIAKAEKVVKEYATAGMIVCGDFNSDGNTAVRKLLVEGVVQPDWYEPQYPDLKLTSKERSHAFGSFVDAVELAYGGNVCDGDYSEILDNSLNADLRPATYVVPNLASLLLLPISDEEGPPRTEFGLQIAQGVAETLNLNDFCEMELDRAFEQADHDGNGLIDKDEIESLLETSYIATYGKQIEQERNNFFRGFGTKANPGEEGLTKEQFITRLKALQQDCEGERKAFGLARGLDLQKLGETEMEQAFERIDLDKNGFLDEDEFQMLLEAVYVSMCGKDIERQRKEFFSGFQRETGACESDELTREQFSDRLLALHQELSGGRKGSELAEVGTEADEVKMISRFTPLLQMALDEVFDKFSSDGDSLTEDEVNEFLVKVNGELGRGGTFRHATSIFQKKTAISNEKKMTRRDWYGIFARELAEGKWWQVVYDLEVCGFNVRSHHTDSGNHQLMYQGWLDYVYANQSLECTGVQDVLNESERRRVYIDGDALPNEWHPSDHLPVSAVFSWI